MTRSVISEGGIRDGHYLQSDCCCTTELTIYRGRVLGEESIICCFLRESPWLATLPLNFLVVQIKHPDPYSFESGRMKPRLHCCLGLTHHSSYLPDSFMRINCFAVIRERGQFVRPEISHSSSDSLGLLAVLFSYIKPVILGLLMRFITDSVLWHPREKAADVRYYVLPLQLVQTGIADRKINTKGSSNWLEVVFLLPWSTPLPLSSASVQLSLPPAILRPLKNFKSVLEILSKVDRFGHYQGGVLGERYLWKSLVKDIS